MSGFSFGTPSATPAAAPPLFGAPASTQTAFSFGAAAPNATASTMAKPGGFNFGAPAATPARAGITAQPSGFSFGSTPTATVQPLQQTASLSFGTPQATAPTNTVQPLSSISFSTPATQPQTTGFSFGQPAATATVAPQAAASLSFGVAAPTVQGHQHSKFSFGQPQAAATTAAPTFGQPAATSTISFGQPAAASSISFGQPAAAPTLTLNPLTTSAPSTGLSFGQPATQTAQPPLFGSNQPTNLIGSLTNQPAQSTTIASLTIPQNVGLGGNDMSTTQPKAAEGKNESTKVKETQVPKEIVQTVEDFKAYVKQQKTLSSDIIRTSDRKLNSVTDEIKSLNCAVQEMSNNVENNKLTIKLLRSDTSRIIQHADMAQRTHETPSGLQFENTMPQIYFKELIQKYENDLLTLKHQVELTEKHLQSLSSPQNFSAQDLKRGLQQIHESFIALAGRLQETHTRVEGQKEQYLNLRKNLLRDSTDVFSRDNTTGSINQSVVQYGPNPFTSSSIGHIGLNLSNQVAVRQWTTQQPTNTTSFFGNSTFNASFKKM